jgi:PAS domain S-box-containing protein
LIGCLSLIGFGQNQLRQLPFSLFHLNTSGGLPQNSVQGFAQDSKGNIWVGTYGGVVKYDGTDVTVFSTETDSNILSNRIIRITGNHKDEIFAATQNGSLIKISESGNQEFKVKGGGFPYGLSTDVDGNALLFLKSGVFQLVDDSIIRSDDFIDFKLPHDPTQVYYNSKDHIAYYLTNRGVFMVSKQEIEELSFYEGKYVNGLLKTGDTLYIHTAATTDIWIGDSLVKQIPNSYRKADRTEFSQTKEGVVWEAHDRGIRRINPDFTYEDFGKSYYMPMLTFRSAFVDVEQNIWLGSNDNGLIRIRPDLFNVYLDYESPGSYNLQGIFPAKDGVWLGMNCEGIGFYSFEEGRISNKALPNYGVYEDFEGGCITSFQLDSDSNLWFGTYGDGLILLRSDSSRALLVENGLYSNTVLSLLSIKDGSMLLGFGKGMQRFNPKTGELQDFYKETSLQSERISQLFEDSKGRIWIGTFNGIYLETGDTLLHFTQEDGLAHNNCRTFYEDELGDVWIGTYGGGLSRYHNDQFQNIGTKDGLFNGVVSAMVRDGDRLWMTCNKGLYAASMSEMRSFYNGETHQIHCISFGTEAGLNTNEFNGGFSKSGFKHANGNMYFPSMNGLVEMINSGLPFIPTPEIFVNNILIDGENTGGTKNLTLEAAVKRISFQISIPTFAYPNNVLSEYKLAGYDEDWKTLPEDRHIDFTNLSAGEYTLELRARSLMSGRSMYKSSSLKFNVLKPWYLNERLLVIFSLLIIGVILLSFMGWRYREKSAKLKLEKAIRRRTNELRENQSRLETVIENTSQLIWSVDKTYRLVTFNKLFEKFAVEIYGFKAKTGLNLPEATKEKTRNFWLSHFEEAMKGKTVNLETRFFIKDEERVMQTELFPIIEKSGEVSGLVGFSTDRTSEVQREKELQEAKIAAEQAAQAKADFLATMSHEIRTPLNGVIGTTSLLKRENLTQHQKDLVETIRLSSDTLMTIINEILDFSKLESGESFLEITPFNPETIVNETLSLVKIKAEEKKLEIINDKKGGLPPLLEGDPTRLKQILLNLLNNAVKFTEEGSVTISSEYINSPTPILRLKVSDTGIGISPEQIKNLFIPFHQLDQSTNRRYGGTGLGLSICKKLTDAMGGNIRASSVEGKGTTFTVEIPAKVSTERAPEPTTELTVPEKLAVVGLPKDLSLEDISKIEVVLNVHGISVFTYESLQDASTSCDVLITTGKTISNNELPLYVLDESSSYDLLPEELIKTFNAFHTKKKPENAVSILVAEDNVVNQKIMGMLLDKIGYSADIVANGIEALDAYERQKYDIILMDVQMPEMDGLDATKELRKRTGSTQIPVIIAVTANAMEGDKERCLNAGMNDYLSKPVTLSTLENCLTKWS